MRAYGSRDDRTPVAEVPPSPSQSRNRWDACEPSVRRGPEGSTLIPPKNDPLLVSGGASALRAATETYF